MKKIIIGVPTLNSGGVEVSLVRFLTELSKNKDIKITLLLLKKEGIYLDSIPKGIEIKTVTYVNDIYNYDKKISDIKNIKGIKNKILFFRYRDKLRKLLKANDWENYYKLILSKVNKINGRYDLAIDWHGYGHFMTTVIADCVHTKKKVMWIHDEKNEWLDKVNCWLEKYSNFFCVSKSCMDSLITHYPQLRLKIDTCYNLINYEEIRNKATERIDYKLCDDVCNIITVGRLEWQKGYDIAIKIAEILKERNFKFCWYVIGGGSLKDELDSLIISKNLTNEFKLLGLKPNPFPYIKKGDLYLQPSRHEGYGLAIAEARVLGTIPIATNLSCIKEQIVDGENGYVCELTPDDFAEKIIKVYNDKKLLKKLKSNLACESFDYSDELKKIYNLLK